MNDQTVLHELSVSIGHTVVTAASVAEMRNELNRIAAAYERSQAAWQPIETCPKGTPVLLWEKAAKCATVGIFTDRYTENFRALVHGDDAPWNDFDPAPIFDATHWMPLPPAPKS